MAAKLTRPDLLHVQLVDVTKERVTARPWPGHYDYPASIARECQHAADYLQLPVTLTGKFDDSHTFQPKKKRIRNGL